MHIALHDRVAYSVCLHSTCCAIFFYMFSTTHERVHVIKSGRALNAYACAVREAVERVATGTQDALPPADTVGQHFVQIQSNLFNTLFRRNERKRSEQRNKR